MLDRLKTLVGPRGAAKEDPAALTSSHHLACAALMVEAARQDGSFEESEEMKILHLLHDRFGLSHPAAKALLDDAERTVKQAGELHPYAWEVRRHTSEEERVEIVEMLWEVALADGHLDAYEDSLIRNVAGLLFVTDKERGAARKRVEDRLRGS